MEFIIKVPDQVIAEDGDLISFFTAFQLLADRMSTSHFKYGNMRNKYPDSATGIANAEKRINDYMLEGNTENCLDAANFTIIEFIFPSHPKAHFNIQDSNTGLEYRADED